MYKPIPYAVPPHHQYGAIQSVSENWKCSEPVDSEPVSHKHSESLQYCVLLWCDCHKTKFLLRSSLPLHQLDAFWSHIWVRRAAEVLGPQSQLCVDLIERPLVWGSLDAHSHSNRSDTEKALSHTETSYSWVNLTSQYNIPEGICWKMTADF